MIGAVAILRAVRVMIYPGLAAALVFLVPSSSGDIFVTNDYPTVQAAIDAATPGTVIHLGSGRYSELLTINKSLTIQGAGSATTIIQARSTQAASRLLYGTNLLFEPVKIKRPTAAAAIASPTKASNRVKKRILPTLSSEKQKVPTTTIRYVIAVFTYGALI